MSKTILVVDDSPAEIKLMLAALANKGHTLLTAQDGEEALRMHADHHPDLVLLDIVMPKCNGYQVCRELKSTDHPPKIIMVSSKNQPSDRFWGLRQGADEYISKPIDLKLLADAVDRFL